MIPMPEGWANGLPRLRPSVGTWSMERQVIPEKAKADKGIVLAQPPLCTGPVSVLHLYYFTYEMETVVVILILHKETESLRFSHMLKTTQPGSSSPGDPPCPPQCCLALEAGFPGRAFCCLPQAAAEP